MRTGKCEDLFQEHVHTLSRVHWQNRNTRGANQLSWHQFTRAYQVFRASGKDTKAVLVSTSGGHLFFIQMDFTAFLNADC